MTAVEIIGLILALLVMCVGVLGCLLPGIPSTPLVLIAAVGHKLYYQAHSVGWFIMIVLVLLTVISMVLDYLASVYGAKKLGATWRGAVGAVVGGLIGIFFAVPGILIGPFLGAVAFELAGGRNLKESSKAGLGAFLGLIAGALGKFAFCVVMMLLFIVSVFYNTLN